MTMSSDDIKIQQTYATFHGTLVYVQDIVAVDQGQQVIYNVVGDFERRQSSLGRFAGMVVSEQENG